MENIKKKFTKTTTKISQNENTIHTKCIIHPFDPFVHFVVVHIMFIYFYYVFLLILLQGPWYKKKTWNMKCRKTKTKIPFNKSYFLYFVCYPIYTIFFFCYSIHTHTHTEFDTNYPSTIQ